jgi:DNA (cytosine-5)-methyltransferase 1
MNPQHRLLFDDELIVDLFAGGGGLSIACEHALGRSPDIAINHNDDALSMHRANHPQTRHFIADVFEVCPRGATQGRPVGYLHLSPDCTHHSQAAGGQPRDERRRALTWIGRRWAGQVRPRVITLENVRQVLKWGPLIAKRDKATGRVVKRDGTVAAHGEHVARGDQFLVPDPKREGITWRAFVRSLQAMGYIVDWRILCAADYGAGTTRERLFMVARCDGKPIVWPEPTHHKKPARGQKRWVPAADCIDWSIPCPSIFERAKPLADATLRRIARGIQRFVLDSADPFIVPITHHGSDRVNDIDDPLRTITTAHRGEFALCAPTLVGVGGRAGQTEPTPGGSPMNTITAKGDTAIAAATLVQMGYGEREGQAPRSLDITEPLGTIVGTGKHAAACVYLMQANGGFNETPGHDLRRPASTITNSGSQQQMVSAVLVTNTTNHAARDMGDPAPTITTGGHHAAITAHLTTLRKNCVGVPADNPVPTITAGAEHHAAVTCTLSPEHEAGALRVAAFLTTYYGNGQECDPRDPMNTVTTRDRLALVTVVLKGTPYLIVDIGLRMLTPRELYRAQGFPPDYQIEVGHDGRRFPKSAQVRMVGNSVSPPPAAALIAANCGDLRIEPIRRRA